MKIFCENKSCDRNVEVHDNIYTMEFNNDKGERIAVKQHIIGRSKDEKEMFFCSVCGRAIEMYQNFLEYKI